MMKAHHEAILDKFGRVAIPKEIRESLGLLLGSLLKIEQRDRELALCPISEEPRLVQKGGILVAQGEPL
jgi:AbrB family looped-hinge helix DNA binding protein